MSAVVEHHLICRGSTLRGEPFVNSPQQFTGFGVSGNALQHALVTNTAKMPNYLFDIGDDARQVSKVLVARGANSHQVAGQTITL